ncbi:hypothetical protein LWI28_003630 [Acer negundo]|uniref:Uncharacterized protein n=1 Tax=Acer negundo TaxID=4023 RepID=A0AAD5IX91_ACENE|nr:hypothetical protein LWI28_003630 [Acer negundo]
MGCLTAQVFRFSAGFSKSNDEKFRQLLEAVTKKLEIQVDLNESEQDLRWPDAKENGAKKRSYMSIGLGKIGRIDEDKPCYFADDTVLLNSSTSSKSCSSTESEFQRHSFSCSSSTTLQWRHWYWSKLRCVNGKKKCIIDAAKEKLESKSCNKSSSS